VDDALKWKRVELEEVERCIAESEKSIAELNEVIRELERNGSDTSTARAWLALYEKFQGLHIICRDRLRRELGSN
jgi:hypothetical protein